jgi:hypothetical protein
MGKGSWRSVGRETVSYCGHEGSGDGKLDSREYVGLNGEKLIGYFLSIQRKIKLNCDLCMID